MKYPHDLVPFLIACAILLVFLGVCLFSEWVYELITRAWS